jgi:hypothetical protein
LGEIEFPSSTHEGLLFIVAAWDDPTRDTTRALEMKGDLHSQALGTVKKV